MAILQRLLAHPLTRGMSVDDPRTTLLRRDIIESKPFLRAMYCEWYEQIVRALPEGDNVLELGSGAGFFSEYLPSTITSEVFSVPNVRLVADACNLPMCDESLDAIVMTDVLHHIPDVRRFFVEASRCVRKGGKVIMVEPWKTPWSTWVYSTLHPEPFLPDGTWDIPCSGPLSGANGALPWIIFERDRAVFDREFPQWTVRRIDATMPFAYLLSGGVSMRSFLPGWLYPLVRFVERALGDRRGAMFAFIELERTA